MRPRTTLETPADIRRSAMDLLARREHSYAELQRKLRQRGASGDMAEVELDEGEHAGTLDLAESIIESQRAEIELMESMLER